MGISLWQILAILVVVLLLFGTKKLRNAGGDIGEAIKGFKNGIKDEEALKALEQNKPNEANIGPTFEQEKSQSSTASSQ